MNLSTNQSDPVIFAEIFAYLALEPGYLNAMNLKNPRPALIGSGVPEERRRPNGGS
jgi:hypothetical protein